MRRPAGKLPPCPSFWSRIDRTVSVGPWVWEASLQEHTGTCAVYVVSYLGIYVLNTILFPGLSGNKLVSVRNLTVIKND